jgi:excisionase family DNA binding protein
MTSMTIHTPVAVPNAEGTSLRQLDRILRAGSATLVSDDGTRMRLPKSAVRVLRNALRSMAAGQAVALVPQNQALTTQQAADLLGVSRPHVVKLIELGQIPCHKTGSHRRIRLNDLLVYQKHRDAGRKRSLDRLAREAHAAGLYDRAGIPDGGRDE